MTAQAGVERIPINTPVGEFTVWTRRAGDNPRTRMLVLHGGPGANSEMYVALERPIVDAGLEVIFYDQLGSWRSDQPSDPSLWELDRFVDEVEQVRQALGLDAENFVLYGQSWGGILGIEYALAHQEHLKGLVVSNMMASIPAYNEFAERVLMPQLDPDVLARIQQLEASGDTGDEYESLLIEHHYVHHLLRRPFAEWPAEVLEGFEHLNHDVYVPMQGPSELGASGKLVAWDRTADLRRIGTPTLVIGAAHDTMDPQHMEWMAGQFPDGRHLHCPEGSHMALIDDHDTYMRGLVAFLHELDTGPDSPTEVRR